MQMSDRGKTVPLARHAGLPAAMLACVLVLGRLGDAAAAPLVLVEGRRPRCAVVAGPDISASERFAVEELRSFILQMTGADLPVIPPDGLEQGRLLPFMVLV